MMDLINLYFGRDIKFEGEEYSGDSIIRGSAETIEENMKRSYISFLEELEKEFNAADQEEASAEINKKKEGGESNDFKLDFDNLIDDENNIELDFIGAEEDNENINLIFEDDIIEQ